MICRLHDIAFALMVVLMLTERYRDVVAVAVAVAVDSTCCRMSCRTTSYPGSTVPVLILTRTSSCRACDPATDSGSVPFPTLEVVSEERHSCRWGAPTAVLIAGWVLQGEMLRTRDCRPADRPWPTCLLRSAAGVRRPVMLVLLALICPDSRGPGCSSLSRR